MRVGVTAGGGLLLLELLGALVRTMGIYSLDLLLFQLFAPILWGTTLVAGFLAVRGTLKVRASLVTGTVIWLVVLLADLFLQGYAFRYGVGEFLRGSSAYGLPYSYWLPSRLADLLLALVLAFAGGVVAILATRRQ
jgi:hypothetical protein